MAEVIELRVHGVGGSPPEGLLGVAAATDTVQVAGDGETAFVARRDDLHVQGYIWGNLTEKPLLQPLWLFLLPFTLVNVSGWMHRPVAELRRPARLWLALFRGLVLAIGILFTASYFVWLSNTVVNRLYHGQTWLHLAGTPRGRIVLGGVVMMGALFLVWLLAGITQRKFDAVLPPGAVREAEGPDVMAPDVTLRDPGFWNRPGWSRALLMIHVATGLAAIAWVTAVAWTRATPVDGVGRSQLGISILATNVTELTLWGVVALTVVHLIGWGRRPAGVRRFRWLGPTTAATTGIAYGTMFLYAIPVLFGAQSQGRVAVMASSFGIGALALAAAGLWLGAWIVVRTRRELRLAGGSTPPQAVPPNPPGRRGDEPLGATPAVYGKIARSRAMSDAGSNATVLLTVSALAFLVVALYQFRFGPIASLDWSVRLGEIVAAAGSATVLVFLIRNARKPNERRVVGILWDVLTFWPRRWHPFGVRPYAERAVPELQERVLRLTSTGRRVLLSTHSQGTVLGYAALVQFLLLPEETLRRVAFVTYGSPIRQLYEMAFPAFFSRQGYDRLRGRLFDDGRSPPASWRGFYRLTDYIGKTVFGDPALEEPVPDPAQEPLAAGAPLDRPFVPAYPDTPRTPWVELALHSYYNREPQLKAWVREVRCRMGEPHLPCDPPPEGSPIGSVD